MSRTTVTIAGQELSLSNLDKVLYPATADGPAITKAAIIDYYVKIAPALLPHLSGRPLTMKRFPDGIHAKPFFEKRCPSHAPDFVGTVRLGREGKDKVVDHCDIDSVAALAWVANMASLELHSSLARGPDTFTPTCVVFDLDPGEGVDVVGCGQVALWLREVFDRLGLTGVPKTSGSKGLQVYVPVNTPVDYDTTRSFALAIGELLARVHPDDVLTNMAKKERVGKVFIDWSQNSLTKTTVSVYSLRAKERPTASTPVTWEEVEQAVADEDPTQLSFDMHEVLARVEVHGDLFAEVETVEQQLPTLG